MFHNNIRRQSSHSRFNELIESALPVLFNRFASDRGKACKESI